MYGGGAGDAAAGDSERTAFRKAEKVYKLYKSSARRSRSVRALLSLCPPPSAGGLETLIPEPPPAVLLAGRSRVSSSTRQISPGSSTSPPSSTISASAASRRRGLSDSSAPISRRPSSASATDQVAEIRRFPRLPRFLVSSIHRIFSSAGFFFIPGALSVEEQCRWVRESLAAFPEPPNRTNHTAIYGPLCGLLGAARRNKVLAEIEAPPEDGDASIGPRHSFVGDGEGRPCEPRLPALSLLRKLRWSTLGLQFDWSKVRDSPSLLL